jgi:hypothetical protein
MALPISELTPDNCIFMMIDHQVGLMSLMNSYLGSAKNAEGVKQMLEFTGSPPIG